MSGAAEAPVSSDPMTQELEIRRFVRALVAGLLLATTVAGLPRGVLAQIGGVVLDPDGQPLPGATVEAWGPGSRIAVRATDGEGRFSFSEDVSRATLSLYARRIGYQAVRVQVEPGVTEYSIRLEAEPLRIEGVVAETDQDFCASRPDREARRIWEALKRRYSDAVDTLGVATYLAAAERTVSLDGLGPLDLPEMGYEQRGSSLHLRVGWRRWIRDHGYGRRILRNGPQGGYESWVYPPLQADFAPHFAEEEFGRLHDFRLLDRLDDGWLLGFCPRSPDDDRPWVKGRMRVSADTLLAWAEWRFHTPEPDEHAGGRAAFPAVRRGERVFLLPTEGIFWRRLPDGTYDLTHEKYEGWLVSKGDSVPFLPRRGPER